MLLALGPMKDSLHMAAVTREQPGCVGWQVLPRQGRRLHPPCSPDSSQPHSPDSSLPASLFCFCPPFPLPREAAAGTRSSSCNTEFCVHFWEPLKWLYAENQCMKSCPWVSESPQFLSKPWSKQELLSSACPSRGSREDTSRAELLLMLWK